MEWLLHNRPITHPLRLKWLDDINQSHRDCTINNADLVSIIDRRRKFPDFFSGIANACFVGAEALDIDASQFNLIFIDQIEFPALALVDAHEIQQQIALLQNFNLLLVESIPCKGEYGH
jgi:hypothetical protein